MRNLSAPRAARRAIALTLAVTVILCLLAPLPAGAAVEPTGVTERIQIEEVGGALEFVGPQTVSQGDELEIVNETNPHKVGPHTFSLVTRGSLPKTAPARQRCFTARRICFSIARWHAVRGYGPPTRNPAEAGPEGWSTMGNLDRPGDSWFTGRAGSSFSQQVTAAPQTLYFMCAIHPWLQGRVTVVPPPLPGS